MATISKFVDRKPSTITTWCKDWQERRMSSMYTGHAGNQNASKLTSTQRREIDMILAQPPSEMGLPGEFWDIPTVSHLVYASFGVTYESNSSYHFLLRHAGLSFHKPEAHDKRRADEAVIGARMSEIRQELIPALHDPHSIVSPAMKSGLSMKQSYDAPGTSAVQKPHLKSTESATINPILDSSTKTLASVSSTDCHTKKVTSSSTLSLTSLSNTRASTSQSCGITPHFIAVKNSANS